MAENKVAKITGFKIGELSVQIDAPEGATLKQVLAAAGIHQEGSTFVINGDRATLTDVVRPGDKVEVQPKPRAGR